MTIRLDISKGIDPVPVYSDIRNDTRHARIGEKSYTFLGQLPFTLKRINKNWCADKALILKHADKALLAEPLETIRG